MQPFPVPPHVLNDRTVWTRSLLEGRYDFRTYPYHHVTVMQQPGIKTTELMYVADMLLPLGWELVNIFAVGHEGRSMAACFRRVRPM